MTKRNEKTAAKKNTKQVVEKDWVGVCEVYPTHVIICVAPGKWRTVDFPAAK